MQDDYLLSIGKCINISDGRERKHCLFDARAARRESTQLCHSQLTARRAVCAALGEDRYEPDFDPASFDADFANLSNPNPYQPLSIGNRWEYRGGTESVTVEVTDRTKLIEGVTCIVVNDRVTENGELIEDTDDWFAQALNGDVYYCGEEVKDFETFEGDNPMKPELVSIDGSFKAGRDGDKAGIIFQGAPHQGEVYRQEFSLNNAEDVAQVLSTNYEFGNSPELDQFVPQALAELLCFGDCVVTLEFSPLEPGIFERKYYAPGIGRFLTVKPDTGTTSQLVGCNFASSCASLPAP